MPLRTLEPESSASANSATTACRGKNDTVERLINMSTVRLMIMAGVLGLEPRYDGVRVRCLTNLATPQYNTTN